MDAKTEWEWRDKKWGNRGNFEARIGIQFFEKKQKLDFVLNCLEMFLQAIDV